MKVIPIVFERDLMKIIPVVFERTWWRLFQSSLSVPDEGYFSRLWVYLMKVIPVVFKRT
jgi:hypothetical protein